MIDKFPKPALQDGFILYYMDRENFNNAIRVAVGRFSEYHIYLINEEQLCEIILKRQQKRKGCLKQTKPQINKSGETITSILKSNPSNLFTKIIFLLLRAIS